MKVFILMIKFALAKIGLTLMEVWLEVLNALQ